MNEQERINQRLGIVNLVAVDANNFATLGEVPDWLREFNPDIKPDVPFSLPDTFLFFDSYLEEIRHVLTQDPDAISNSGPWSEANRRGAERNLAATGFMVDDRMTIQLKLIDDTRLYHQAVFQKARNYSMGYERLMKERERREVLLHTIVHDLAGPLTAIQGALELLESEPDRGQLVRIALKQCGVERDMIKSILDTFSADFAPFDPENITWDSAPRICDLLIDQVDMFQAPFESQGVTLEFDNRIEQSWELRVFAEQLLLERVISNLLQNALRYSPRDSVTRVELSQDGDRLWVAVEDQGEGVPEEQRTKIFDRFSGGQRFGGKVGLGLYFCRITLGRWGETIRCDPLVAKPVGGQRPGTRMVFSLTPLPADSQS